MNAAQKKSLKRKLYIYTGGRCCYCNKKISEQKATIEHFIPLSMGKEIAENPDNLTICCRSTNQFFGDMHPMAKMMLVSEWQGKFPCSKFGKISKSDEEES